MFLAIDIGNTQTNFGRFENGKMTHQWVRQTQRAQTPDELASYFLSLLQIEKLENRWQGVAICSVVPTVTRGFVQFSQRYLDCSPFVVEVNSRLRFPLNVREPHSVGADRLANVAYALDRLLLPAIVVDCGTATTLDAISASGAYEGGSILPGVGLALESLSIKTAQLPLVAPRIPERVIGKTTEECIQSGVLLGYADQIVGLIKRTTAELGGKASVAVTGGYGSLFKACLPSDTLFDPHLTLIGTYLLAQPPKPNPS